MKTPNELKQIVNKKEKHNTTVKVSGCCEPTCCSGSDKKNINRKEK